jgi:hypothetical protein
MVLLICYERTSDFDLGQAIEVVAMAIFDPNVVSLSVITLHKGPRFVKARL